MNFIHNHSPHAHCRFAPKICPHPGAFASKLFPGGWGFVGAAPKRRAFLLINYVCHLKKFSLLWQELTTDNILVFTCFSEILYVLQKCYSILDLEHKNVMAQYGKKILTVQFPE